jgi:peptidoglycan/LPS O-acetylase OafA/YrhL
VPAFALHTHYHKSGEIPSLTGLRGLAALLVVVEHYWYWARVTPVAALPPAVTPWAATSGIAMAIFFTLSGYVIALSYSHWDWRARPAFNLLRLFSYRFARLYPAFLVFAIFIILRQPALRDHLSEPRIQEYLMPHFFLWHAWWPFKLDGIPAAEGHFHVSWSLSVECALYLFFGFGAVFAASLPNWRAKPLVLATAFFILTSAILQSLLLMRADLIPEGWSDAEWMKWLLQISPWATVLQFGLGVAAYKLSRVPVTKTLLRIISNVGAAGLIAVYILTAERLIVEAFQTSVFAALATSLVLLGCGANSVTNRALSRRGIVYIGTISYSLYLFHFITPGLSLGAVSFDVFDRTAAVYHALNFLASLALAVFLSTGVYYVIEVPGRRAIRAIADRLLGLQRAPGLDKQRDDRPLLGTGPV